MALKVTYKHPDFDDQVVGVTGLGEFETGKAKTLTAEEEAEFEAHFGMSFKDWAKGSEDWKVEGTSEVKNHATAKADEGGDK